ncbi:MAG: hypothetical protein GC201_13280 [Alphaproteobacteria bacterium]|nr:hypothetical protein [Alphaproteobacteria bacterium]
MATVFTVENIPDHVASYRARIERRRIAIESRPREKRFALAEPPPESKEFIKAMFDAAVFGDLRIRDDDLPNIFRAPSHELTAEEETLARVFRRAQVRLGREFIEAARDGDGDLVRAFMEEGFPMAWSEDRNRETALHAAAGSRARPAIRVLVQHWPDFLIRDRRGRLASELAYLYGEDPAMAHLLGIKERKDALATGRPVARRVYAYRP